MTIPWTTGEVLTASSLNNATNWIWIPAAQFSGALNTPPLGVTGAWSNTAQSIQFVDGVLGTSVTSFYAPESGNLNF